ncbi:MAG: class I SAM-dependent methyltransferase [Dokdonella sp.]
MLKFLKKAPSPQLEIDETAVRWAYRIALGREPESDAIVRAYSQRLTTLEELRDTFFGSAEFRGQVSAKVDGIAPPQPSGLEPAMRINCPDRADLRARVFKHIAESWSHFGETEPYWSVLTTDEFRKDRLEENIEAFSEFGATDVNRFLATLKRNGLSIPAGAHCIELGCGVGRLTRWLAPHFAKITALDVSPGHLALAKENVEKHARNVDFRQLRRVEDLQELPTAQVFFTFLVLQHNPPPVIEALLDGIFSRLAPGAIAYFHLQTYAPDYHFDLESYLADHEGKITMEMHALPQKDVFRIAARHGMRTIEVLNQTNPQRMVADYFLMQKN